MADRRQGALVSPHVDPRLFEIAGGDQRRAMVEHLRNCPACRSEAAAFDPSILFSLLAAAPIPKVVLDDVSAEVSRRAGSDRGSIGGLMAAMPAARVRVAAAAVVALVLVSGYATMRRPARELAATEAASVPPTVAQRADVDVLPARAVSQVVDFTVGETQVVMVYNGDLQL
jgi:anti-sigma factor RsiW